MTEELLGIIEYNNKYNLWIRKGDGKFLTNLSIDPENRHYDLYFIESGKPFNLSYFETWCFDHGYIEQLDSKAYELRWKNPFEIEGISQIINEIRDTRNSAIFFDYSTLWAANKALTEPVDKGGKLNAIYILSLIVLSQAIILFDRIYCLYPTKDILSFNNELSEEVITALPISYDSAWYCYDKLCHVASRFECKDLKKKGEEWNKYTLDEAQAILSQWKVVFGNRFVTPELESLNFSAKLIPHDLRTPVSKIRDFQRSVRLPDTRYNPDPSISDPYSVIYHAIRTIYNYEISSSVGLPYYGGCINRPVLEYVLRQSIPISQLCNTLKDFLSKTSYIQKLSESEIIFRIPSTFTEIMENWSSTKIINPQEFLKKLKELRRKYAHIRSDFANYRNAIQNNDFKSAKNIFKQYAKSSTKISSITVKGIELGMRGLLIAGVVSANIVNPYLFGLAVLAALAVPELVEKKLKQLIRPHFGLADSSLTTIQMHELLGKTEKIWRAKFSEMDRCLIFHLSKYQDSLLESIRSK